ncbi:MAG: hypothetical protein U0625_05320 [Phycisphaerales bacterium]
MNHAICAERPLRACGIRVAAALGLALASASALQAAVPPPEKVPVTQTLTAPGVPATAEVWQSATNKDVCIFVTRGDASSSDQQIPRPLVVRWWQRGTDGAWIWRGLLEIPGWPALQAVSYSVPAGALATSEDARRTTLAVPVNGSQIAVARFESGAWSSLGVIQMPAGETVTSLQVRDNLVVGRTAQRIWVARRGGDGSWILSTATPEELGIEGAPSVSVSLMIVNGDRLLVRSMRNTTAQQTGSLRPRFDWIEMGPSGLARGPAQPLLVPDQFNFGRIQIADGAAVATVARTDSVGQQVITDTVVFATVGADGVLIPAQVERMRGTPGTANSLNALAQGRVLALGRAWSRDSAGRWQPGAYIPVGSWTEGTTLVSGASAIRIVENAFDCDGDGVDDAIAIANGWATDCDANGHPDDCDIALGMVADANGDGVPDHCVPDCDANGVADLAQLRNGARESCAGDGTLAACQIAAGELDRDGNGVPDLCDADRNGNGIPDVIEIAEGAATDCDGDWRIDDAPAASNGWPMSTSSYGWGYFAQSLPGLWVVSAVRTAELGDSLDGFRFPIVVGTSPLSQIDGRPMIAFVAVDPTDDLDPRDAQVIWWQSSVFAPDRTQQDWAAGNPSSGFPRYWQYVATPHLEIDAPTVWLGVCYPPDTIGGQTGLPSAVCALLVGNAPSGTFTSQGAGSSCWYLPTTASSATDPASALASPVIAPAPFIATVQAYSHGCPRVGDVDGNGRVDGADLGRLLGDWGLAYGSPCDLNRDNSVDGADLAILIAHFGD